MSTSENQKQTNFNDFTFYLDFTCVWLTFKNKSNLDELINFHKITESLANDFACFINIKK